MFTISLLLFGFLSFSDVFSVFVLDFFIFFSFSFGFLFHLIPQYLLLSFKFSFVTSILIYTPYVTLVFKMRFWWLASDDLVFGYDHERYRWPFVHGMASSHKPNHQTYEHSNYLFNSIDKRFQTKLFVISTKRAISEKKKFDRKVT